MKTHNLPSSAPIYIVDDDESVLDSLTFMLEAYDFEVSAFTHGQAFLEAAQLNAAGCVILDSRMPELRGQEIQQLLTQENSPLSVIFLTGHGDVSMAVNALKSGAVDFFQKPVEGERLVKAIKLACQQSHKQHQYFQILEAYQSLTARESEVLALIAEGKRNQAISDALCIALRTVEVHRAKIMKKFNASTIAELAMQYGMLLDKG